MNLENRPPEDSNKSDAAAGRWETLRRSLSSFHREERGDAVQAILIIFVAVIVLIALVNFFFPSVWDTLKQRIEQLIEEKE